MKPLRYRFPIALKMAVWLLLNLALLALGGWLVFRSQFRAGFGSYLANAAAPRVEALASVAVRTLRATDESQWNGALASLSNTQGVKLAIFENAGNWVAGERFDLPETVKKQLAQSGHSNSPPPRPPPPPRRDPGERGPRPRPEGPGGPPDGRFGPEGGGPGEPRRSGPRPFGFARGPRFDAAGDPNEVQMWPKFLVATDRPGAYWIGIRAPLSDERETPRTLLVRCDSLSQGGLLLEVKPLVVAGAGAILASVLFWLPFAFGLTRQLRRVTAATAKVASGDFDIRLRAGSGDEIGELAQSVNTMASQLDSLVRGQKRFLGDVAHELCSPVSRMQAALAILEDRATEEKQLQYVASLREELDDMSRLVDELLQFSKASVQREIALQSIALAPLVAGVVAREAAGVEVECDVPNDLTVQTEPTLLSRALGNVLRNAVRYAGGAGPIVVSAAPQQGGIALIVADSGSGVSPESLPRLFDAFYRPDSARTRETGGAGLGLAIVKTCIEACGGRVAARNGRNSGLEVIFALPSPTPG